MGFLDRRGVVVAGTAAVAGALVLGALAVSAAASPDDLTRSGRTAVVVGADPSRRAAPFAPSAPDRSTPGSSRTGSSSDHDDDANWSGHGSGHTDGEHGPGHGSSHDERGEEPHG